MYVTFKNNSTSEKMIVNVENQKYIIKPENYVEVFCHSEKVEFVTETSASPTKKTQKKIMIIHWLINLLQKTVMINGC